MLFSVIVPVYNVESYLTECINSIVNQRYTDNFEILLIDDGSTDNSAQICDGYAKLDTRVYAFHKKNGGLSDARNFGVNVAKGDYIIFVDSDDYIAEDTLSILCEKCSKRCLPDVVLSEGMYDVYNKEIVVKNFHWNQKDFVNCNGEIAYQKTSNIFANWSPCGKAFRRKMWVEKGYRFVLNRKAEDFQLIDKVVIGANVVTMVTGFYYYRHREGSIMNTYDAKFLNDIMCSIREWESYIMEASLNKKTVAVLRERYSYLFCHDIIGSIYIIPKVKRNEILQKIDELKFVLNYSSNLEVKLVKLSINLLGLKITGWLTGCVKMWRIKKNRKNS